MSTVATYRAQLLARRARAAGCTVAELLARGEREADVTRRVNEIRRDRSIARATIAGRAAELGHGWTVVR